MKLLLRFWCICVSSLSALFIIVSVVGNLRSSDYALQCVVDSVAFVRVASVLQSNVNLHAGAPASKCLYSNGVDLSSYVFRLLCTIGKLPRKSWQLKLLLSLACQVVSFCVK